MKAASERYSEVALRNETAAWEYPVPRFLLCSYNTLKGRQIPVRTRFFWQRSQA